LHLLFFPDFFLVPEPTMAVPFPGKHVPSSPIFLPAQTHPVAQTADAGVDTVKLFIPFH
jgi:hypothetical protein